MNNPINIPFFHDLVIQGFGYAPGTFATKWTLTDVDANSSINLPTVRIKDIPDNSPVTLPVGWLVSINGSDYAAGPTTMSEGDRISTQVPTGDYEAVVTGNVVINSINCAVSVTSEAEANVVLLQDGEGMILQDGETMAW